MLNQTTDVQKCNFSEVQVKAQSCLIWIFKFELMNWKLIENSLKYNFLLLWTFLYWFYIRKYQSFSRKFLSEMQIFRYSELSFPLFKGKFVWKLRWPNFFPITDMNFTLPRFRYWQIFCTKNVQIEWRKFNCEKDDIFYACQNFSLERQTIENYWNSFIVFG